MSAFKMMFKASVHQFKLAAFALSLMAAFVSAPALAQAPAAAPAAKPAAAKPSGGFVPPGSSGTLIDAIAVVVNDEVITRNEINARIQTVTQRMQAQKIALPEAADMRRQIIEA